MRLPTLARFFLFSFIFFVLIFFGSQVRSASAQNDYGQYPNSSVSNQANYAAPNTTDDVPKNLHTYTQNVMIETMAALACQIAGVDPTQPDGRCLGFNPKTGKIGYVENGGGAIGFMGGMISVLYEPPVHTTDYAEYLAQNFGFSNKTYARIINVEDPWEGSKDTGSLETTGIGFKGLSPLMKIWSTFRDIAYLLFVLIFIVIGVTIMLRIKIDPRTVMTIQNQIPKIIIGLLLVTFSFAIAGFLIDIMWIAIYLLYGTFASIGIDVVDVTSLNPQKLVGSTPLSGVGGLGGIADIANNGSNVIKDAIAGLFDNSAGSIVTGILGGLIGGAACLGLGPLAVGCALFGAGVGTFVGGTLLSSLGYLVAFLIIAVALLWALVRVWFALLMAYISILLGVVFAPFWIIGSMIPGSKISFIGWLRSMAGNLAAFPATIAMFLLGKTFIDAFASPTPVESNFLPPLIGNPADFKGFGAIIGLGIILMTPNVVKMMKNAFGAGQSNEPSPIGQALGVGGAYPVNVGKGIGQTIAGRNEYRITKIGQQDEASYGKVGTLRALGRKFGIG